mmetsp:Transcript_36102/g.103711  ORF Transcript_36102/g.103711 Transcript_36102/m.103711 type:complete len:129 (+) Transcript_36102:56-442(+)
MLDGAISCVFLVAVFVRSLSIASAAFVDAVRLSASPGVKKRRMVAHSLSLPEQLMEADGAMSVDHGGLQELVTEGGQDLSATAARWTNELAQKGDEIMWALREGVERVSHGRACCLPLTRASARRMSM